MKLVSHLPLAALCLGIGGLFGIVIDNQIHGQIAPPIVMPKELTSYRDVVKRVVPAVVSIEAKATKRVANRRPQQQLPPNVPEEFRKYFEGMNQDDQNSNPNLGFGSGFVIDPSGVIFTNFHVVDGADTLEVGFPDGRKFTTGDIVRDPKTDLAVVRIKSDKPLPFLEFGDSDAMEVGDRVLAVGAPYGLTGTVTQGIVSAKSRQNLKLNQYEDFLQTDAAMNPGNSGGPLVNLEGRVVGINSAIKTRGGGSNGVGLAVSSNLAKDVSNQLLRGGSVKRGYLGVGVREVDAELATRLGVPADSNPVLVTKVYDKTPAAKAGLRAGDVILSVGGTQLKDVNTLPRLVAKMPLGQSTEVQIVRDGKVTTVGVTIEEQPDDYGQERTARSTPNRVPADVGLDVAGLNVSDLTPALAAQLGFPRDTKGALIMSVDRGSAAANVGLVRGLLIVKVDKAAVTSAKDFEQAMASASKEKGALLQVTRPNGESDFVVLKVK
ncbi:Do family serine endopeptidase [Limnoglobus roseus]|uniref:PDZ domain-containing protein n=1 Tax=Limnoglobus roseus TaxID=2598579 RepID=A0A5C1A9L7_9BACT|nr:Do family serine endopeptidase [Limnoglobus roseus]QEL15245.1 PDZ domain-containing protein [Limnoglobus roseus]